jgi:hypothetical protein
VASWKGIKTMTKLQQLEITKTIISGLQEETNKVYDEFTTKVDITGIEDEVFDYLFNNTQYVYHDIKSKLEENED